MYSIAFEKISNHLHENDKHDIKRSFSQEVKLCRMKNNQPNGIAKQSWKLFSFPIMEEEKEVGVFDYLKIFWKFMQLLKEATY